MTGVPAVTSNPSEPAGAAERGRGALRRMALGLGLVGLAWPLNWGLPGMRTAYLFFPLWAGYVLAVDGWVERRSGTSLWRRSPREFLVLALASAPLWCLFEVANGRTRNWEYLGSETLAEPLFLLLCALNFATVMPAVFETAELVATFGWIERFGNGPRFAMTRGRALGGLVVGVATGVLWVAWPRGFYWLLWVTWYLVFESLNWLGGRPTLVRHAAAGNWRPVVALAAGVLVCAFFWEFWNWRSFPKWIYHTPGVQFLHVFEMPLLGYLGYLPFAWELFALRACFWPRAGGLRIAGDGRAA